MKELSVGDIAPDFTKPSTERDAFGLYDQLRHGPVLLNFYIGDFGVRCTDYMMRLIERKDGFDSLGVRIVGINPDGLDSHRIWKERMGSDLEHIWDEGQDVSRRYGAIVDEDGSMVKGFTNREFFLIGTDRRIRYIWRASSPRELPDPDRILEGVKEGLGIQL